MAGECVCVSRAGKGALVVSNNIYIWMDGWTFKVFSLMWIGSNGLKSLSRVQV